jgi:Holliday junction resolvase|tara:strand:- start:239 stop:730 length:492 start_codon:yes stop_codon:yes gene_type:complete
VVNSRQKGSRAEQQIAHLLGINSGETFTQTPGSGSGKIKGDLYVKDKHNIFMIEVKHYRDMAFNQKIFTQKNNNFVKWWTKAIAQAEQMQQEPLLFMKQNYSQWYVTTTREPKKEKRYMYINWLGAYILLADKWLENEELEFTNGDNILRPWEPDPEWELTYS